MADGNACDNPDLGILNMRADFVKNHRDVAKGYLRAELEAQRYMLDPANWENVINMVSKYATGIPKNVLWYSIYGLVPSDSSDPVREWKNFYFGDRENANIVEVAPFLFKSKIISMEKLPDGTVDDTLAREVFKEAGYAPASPDAALGVIKGAKAARLPLQELTGPSGPFPAGAEPAIENRLRPGPPLRAASQPLRLKRAFHKAEPTPTPRGTP